MQKGLRGREAQAAVVTGKFFHEPKIAQLHDEPALIRREEAVDFRLANRLLKGDAGERFERSCHFKISALAPLCSLKYCASALLYLCSAEGNHPIDNPQLEASEAKAPVAGEERGNKLCAFPRGPCNRHCFAVTGV